MRTLDVRTAANIQAFNLRGNGSLEVIFPRHLPPRASGGDPRAGTDEAPLARLASARAPP